MSYDSREDTLKHINNVREKILRVISNLTYRALDHDRSKLSSPEKEVYDKYTPLLRDTEYGSDRYNKLLHEMDHGVRHHWSHNDHHPEHNINGIDGMNLLSLLEMICDWKAASERHTTGDLRKSIEYNTDRFKISPQLKNILLNTVEEMGW